MQITSEIMCINESVYDVKYFDLYITVNVSEA